MGQGLFFRYLEKGANTTQKVEAIALTRSLLSSSLPLSTILKEFDKASLPNCPFHAALRLVLKDSYHVRPRRP